MLTLQRASSLRSHARHRIIVAAPLGSRRTTSRTNVGSADPRLGHINHKKKSASPLSASPHPP